MSFSPHHPLVLVANNPFGHHLLTSQLLDHYCAMRLDVDIILLCNGVMLEGNQTHLRGLRVIDFSSRFGVLFSYANLLVKLVLIRLRYPHAVYHLRGFVSGLLFVISRLCLLGSARYIYDPRGAFFIEWREARKLRAISRIFRFVESRLVLHAQTTIVTSNRFARLYSRLFETNGTYVTIYNSTSFAYLEGGKPVPAAGPIRLVYLGTFNEWHDMSELFRVMSHAALQLGPDRVELHIFTPRRFHDKVRDTFAKIACRKVDIDYVNYKDIPERLSGMHVGVSIVRPTLSTRIASPIKISDYIALGLVPLLNQGVGDFDDHFRRENSAILFTYQGVLDMSNLANVRTNPNRRIFDAVSQASALGTLRPTVTKLLEG